MNPQPVPIPDFIDALHDGDTDTIIRAATSGTPMHPPVLSIWGEETPGKEIALSPLTLIRKWNWRQRKEQCLEALKALLDAGADPNLPDDKKCLPLATSLFALADSLPPQAVRMFLEAGADPGLSSFLTDGRDHSTALLQCVSDQLEEHARVILDARPESAKTPEGMIAALVLLDDTIAWWEKGAAQRTATRLVQCGAHEDADVDALGSPLRGWVQGAIAESLAERMDQSLSSDPENPKPPRISPRL